MKCFYHEDREAVATCQHCGKALCRACASLYTPCLCVDCAQLLRDQQAEQARAAEEDHRRKYLDALVDTRAEFLRTCVYGAVTALVLGQTLFQSSAAGPERMLYAVWFFFIPFGWKLITYLQSFLPLTIFGTLWFWIFWALAKGIISIFIGIPAFLYQLVKTFFVQRKIQAASRSCRQDAEGI